MKPNKQNNKCHQHLTLFPTHAQLWYLIPTHYLILLQTHLTSFSPHDTEIICVCVCVLQNESLTTRQSSVFVLTCTSDDLQTPWVLFAEQMFYRQQASLLCKDNRPVSTCTHSSAHLHIVRREMTTYFAWIHIWGPSNLLKSLFLNLFTLSPSHSWWNTELFSHNNDVKIVLHLRTIGMVHTSLQCTKKSKMC